MSYNYVVFSTDCNKYLFDGVSSNIFMITENIYKNIDKLLVDITNNQYNKYTNDDELELIFAVNTGQLMNVNKKDIKYWFDELEYKNNIIESNYKHIMIEVTKNCNMRCKYCVYGGHYPKEYVHKDEKINFEVIQSAINMFLSSKTNYPEMIVNFYGGEPLLEFQSIAKTVNILKEKNKKIKVYITTNGTLLTDQIIDWFLENEQVYLYISFAGSEQNHDMLRVFPDNSPTYRKIYNNLCKIRERDEQQFYHRVNYIFNIGNIKQLFDIDNMYKNDDLFKNAISLPEISRIDCIDDDGYIEKLCEEIIVGQHINDPIEEYIKRINEGDSFNVFAKYYDEYFLSIHKRVGGMDQPLISGVCQPFLHKIFIDTNGNIHVCENFRDNSMFGNIQNDIKVNKIFEVLEKYKLDRKSDCSICWANKLCLLCFKDFQSRENGVKYATNQKRCSLERERNKNLLMLYCSILEKNSKFFDHLDSYTVRQ